MTFCVLGENCSVYDRAAKCPGVSLYNPLCEGCRNRSDSELNLLRYDYLDLSQIIPRADGHSDAKIARPKPESSPPIDMQVFTLRSNLVWVVRKSEVHLRAFRGDRPAPDLPMREGFALDHSVRYLRSKVDDLALLPDYAGPMGNDGEQCSGVELLLMVGSLHRQARRVCGLDPRTISVPGFCPQCSAQALRRHDDDPDRVWCVQCRHTLSQGAYLAAQRMQFAPSQLRP
jgi:ribosomal protein L37AE/L43A